MRTQCKAHLWQWNGNTAIYTSKVILKHLPRFLQTLWRHISLSFENKLTKEYAIIWDVGHHQTPIRGNTLEVEFVQMNMKEHVPSYWFMMYLYLFDRSRLKEINIFFNHGELKKKNFRSFIEVKPMLQTMYNLSTTSFLFLTTCVTINTILPFLPSSLHSLLY